MPKRMLKTRVSTSSRKDGNASRRKKSKLSDGESSSTSSTERITNEKAIVSKTARDDINSDESETNTLCDINPEIEKLVRSLQAKIKKVAKTKAKQVEDTTCGNLQKQLKLISDLFTSLESKTKICCSLFNTQSSEIYKKMEKEHKEFNGQVEKVLSVLQQSIQSYEEYKTSQEKNLKNLQEISASFMRAMASHIKNMHENCDVSLNHLEKDVQILQKSITKKVQVHERINVRNSLNSMFW